MLMVVNKQLREFILGKPGKFLLGLSFSVITLFLSFRSVSIFQIKAIFSQVQWMWVVFAILVFLINNLIKTFRWQVLLGGPGRRVSFFSILSALFVSQMVNFIFPVKLGELTRVHQIGILGPGRSFVLGTIIVEKVIDMLAYGVLFFLLVLSIPLPDWISGTGILFTITSAIFVILLYITIYHPNLVKKTGYSLAEYFPDRIRISFCLGLDKGLTSLTQLKNSRMVACIAAYTVITWFTSVLVNLLIFHSVGIPLGWQASLVTLLALQAVISIPSVPGRIGVFEYICILALGFFGVSQATALSYGLLLHAVVLLPILVLGTIFLAIKGSQP
jgi:glycosyltransferase 2 family protein